MFEEAHLWVHEWSMRFLSFIKSPSEYFALPEDISCRGEYFFDWGKAIGIEVSTHFAFLRLWVVVAIEVEDPKGIQMRMNGHMEGVGGEANSII